MTNRKKLVALTGAGISAESGISTFRGSGGLWEQYDVMEIASTEGWNKNPELVQRFYNDRRKQLGEVEPNAAHRILSELEKDFDVTVITQNVDNLHERAGSTKIIHLHGELTKVCSSDNPDLVIDVGYRAIEPDEKASDGNRLRPHVVWFGEMVLMIEPAKKIVSECEILVVVGTSLNVYPAAGLIQYAAKNIPIFLIDPDEISYCGRNIRQIREKATTGMKIFKETLKNMLENEPSEPKQMNLTFVETNELTIKVAGVGTIVIDWGDGTANETHILTSPEPSSVVTFWHTYHEASTRTVTITGENITCLACDDPQLTGLDLGRNAALKSLICINNQVTSLDVSNNTALNNLICVGNQLASLNVSNNLVLTRLNCSGNQLSTKALNELFSTLPPPITVIGKIQISGNPGEVECDKSIAEINGWWLS